MNPSSNLVALHLIERVKKLSDAVIDVNDLIINLDDTADDFI